jgi:hypothetical protein
MALIVVEIFILRFLGGLRDDIVISIVTAGNYRHIDANFP